jgi:stress-induced morphogen
MMIASEIRDRLSAAFPSATIEVVDMTGTQDHYQARIVSEQFSGKSPIEQHQLVYRALGDAMNGPIHALALETYTPAAWRLVNGGNL